MIISCLCLDGTVASMILNQFGLKGNNKSRYGMETKEYIIFRIYKSQGFSLYSSRQIDSYYTYYTSFSLEWQGLFPVQAIFHGVNAIYMYIVILICVVGSLVDSNKENLIDSPNTVIMTRQWKRNLHKQISVFRQIMLDIGR